MYNRASRLLCFDFFLFKNDITEDMTKLHVDVNLILLYTQTADTVQVSYIHEIPTSTDRPANMALFLGGDLKNR